jgi:hypothetical protein
MRTHICIVSAQAAATLLPAIDQELKANQVVLLVSPQMKKQAEFLQQAFKTSAISSLICPFQDHEDFDELCLEFYQQLDAIKEQIQDREVVYNLTGGNKLMALALREAAGRQAPCFYMNIDTNKIIWLNRQSPAQVISGRINLEQYLLGHGYQISNKQNAPQLKDELKQLTHYLIENVQTLEKSIGSINYWASSAAKTPSYTVQTDTHHPATRELLNRCKKANLLTLQSNQLTFNNPQAIEFLNGGWIEDYVCDALHTLSSHENPIKNLSLNLEVIHTTSKNKNEFDIAFMFKNRLFLIECKTSNLQTKTQGHEDSKDREALYKLEERRRHVGGLATSAMLISYRQLGLEAKNFAKLLGIQCLDAGQLRNLKNHLRQWVKA